MCPKCSTANSTDSLFCISCGFRFNPQSTTQTGLSLNPRTLALGGVAILLVGLFAGLSFFLVNKMSDNSSDKSYKDGQKAGIIEGQKAGYATGLEEGKKSGYNEGFTAGSAAGVSSVGDVEAMKKSSYQNGYSAGSTQALNNCFKKIDDQAIKYGSFYADEVFLLCGGG